MRDLQRSGGQRKTAHRQKNSALFSHSTALQRGRQRVSWAAADETTLFTPPRDDNQDEDMEDEQSSEGEDWEDGATLVSRLMNVDPDAQEAGIEELEETVDALKVPFAKVGQALKNDLIEALVPTLSHIKKTHDDIASGPDKHFEDAISKFHEYSVTYSNAVMGYHEQFEQAQLQTQELTIELFKKLKSAYKRQEELRSEFLTRLKAKVQETLLELNEFDDEVDKMEARVQARLKEIRKVKERNKKEDLMKLLQLDD